MMFGEVTLDKVGKYKPSKWGEVKHEMELAACESGSPNQNPLKISN